MTAPHPVLPPIRRSVAVSWDPETAFHRFTARFAEWWPRRTHSIGGTKVKDIVFECRPGGLIVEELVDGRRFKWGRITAFEPPTRVAFTWHPSRGEDAAQDVEVRFRPEGSGTRVELTSTGWERLGARARRERKGYDIGWESVLEVFAGRRNAAFVVFSIISTLLTLGLRVTGRLEASIDRAGGRLPAGG
jgi:uncharacterized protein YndB with AHSA1/START domain